MAYEVNNRTIKGQGHITSPSFIHQGRIRETKLKTIQGASMYCQCQRNEKLCLLKGRKVTLSSYTKYIFYNNA